MAILERGILGGGRNAVGTVVMSKWRGKDTIRARVTPANPQTPAQTIQRDLFATLTRAGASLMEAFIRPYWRRFEARGRNATTAFNEFVRANVRIMRDGAMPGFAPGTFDAAQLLLTRGELPPAEPTGLADDGGSLRVTWEAAGGPADDAVAVVVTDLAGQLVAVETGAVRGDGGLTLSAPYDDRAGFAFHVVAYRVGATPDQTAVGFHGSIRVDDAGDAVVVHGAAKRAAFASANAAPAAPVESPAALV